MSHVVVRDHPLVSCEPPAWAAAWGCDRSGPWSEFRVADVVQRMRWVPPGQFLMGSPDDEVGRFEREGPQHWVTISNGFWIFDTPCKQGLWEAVMGANPSHFRGAARPVENVSWPDCIEFIESLCRELPSLNLRLPTEAEWEYACRAGEPVTRYGELDQVAWYWDNSNGETHVVGEKTANALGIFDMLGNVWEWCEDNSRRPYTVDAVIDPRHVIPGETAERVLRGGAWLIDARFTRPASRSAYHLDGSNHDLGFRCLSSSQ